MLCRYCGRSPASGGVFCPECFQTRPNRLTPAQYREVLERIRGEIASSVPIGLDDCNAVGVKHTHCAWGVCTDSKEVWSRPEFHMWPMEFIEDGRVAPLTRPSGCPLDGRAPQGSGRHDGCFYSCLAFCPPKGFKLTAEYALALYDEEIAKPKHR